MALNATPLAAGSTRTARERTRRASATRVATSVAIASFILSMLLLIAGRESADEPGLSAPSTTSSDETTTTTNPDGTQTIVRKLSDVEKSAAVDTSLVGRALNNGNAPLLLQVGLSAIAAFVLGGIVQRVALGEYGFTIGPIALNDLPAITEPDAKEVSDLIQNSPSIQILLPSARHPQPLPDLIFLEGDRLKLLSVRIDLEIRLRGLAQSLRLDGDIPLSKLASTIAEVPIDNTAGIDESAAKGLTELLAIGDRIEAGAEVSKSAATQILDAGLTAIYALDELRTIVDSRAKA